MREPDELSRSAAPKAPGGTPRIRWRLVAALFASLWLLGAHSAVLAETARPVKREILALYDGAQESEPDATRIHRFAEKPLNYLGFILRFRDVRDGLPPLEDLDRYRAVLTWFSGPVSIGRAYPAWTALVERSTVRFVILGDVGIDINPTSLPAVNRLMSLAGVHHTGEFVSPTLGSRVVEEDRDLVEFECRFDPVLPDYPVITRSAESARVGATIQSPASDGRRRSVLVAVGPRGAYAAFNYEFCHQRPPLFQGRWLINPFNFFRDSLASVDDPIPDTTTASGQRLYFNIFGSDGLMRPSQIEGFHDAATASGDVAIRELVQPFSGLPATLELRADEAVKSQKPGSPTEAMLHRLLANPNLDLLMRGMQATLSRFDSEYPSISNLSPLISAGHDHFINRPMSDETAYNNQSAPGETGYPLLSETMADTEAPRRLNPLDINYHAYDGQYPALLRAVAEHLTLANKLTLTPISANTYAAIVDGFFSAQIDRIGAASWTVRNRGALQTLRFENADAVDVDMASSAGVIGQIRKGRVLYVALDEAVEPVVVALQPAHDDRPGSPLALTQSRWRLRGFVKDGCGLHFDAQGYGEGSFSWTGANRGSYRVDVSREGKPLLQTVAQADAAGNLSFTLPVSAVVSVHVRLGCPDDVRNLIH